MPILRISRGKIRPGSWAEFEASYRKAIAAVGPVPGLLLRSLSRNSANPDEGFSMSVWEDEGAAKAYEQSELSKTVNPLLKEYFTGDYRLDHCEICHWENVAKLSV